MHVEEIDSNQKDKHILKLSLSYSSSNSNSDNDKHEDNKSDSVKKMMLSDCFFLVIRI